MICKDQYFHEAHRSCTQTQCLARNFVVFSSVLDLKGHIAEEHGSPKDARHGADFASEDAGSREREPPPSQPPPSLTISRPRPTGQSRLRAAFGARLTVDGVPITDSAPSSSPGTLEANLTSTLGTDDVGPTVVEYVYISSSMIESDNQSCRRYSALAPHLQLVMNPTTTVPTAMAAMRISASESSARDFISTIWNII